MSHGRLRLRAIDPAAAARVPAAERPVPPGPEPARPVGGPATGQRRPAPPGGGRPRVEESRVRARRHSTFVALMKGLLPGLAFCLLVGFVFYAQGGFAPALPEGFAFDPGELDLSGGGIKMTSPRLTGLDQDNQRFEVTASSAIQDADNPALITLEAISGRMQLNDGGWVRVVADGGAFNSDESLLVLEDAIEVTMSSGYVAKLNGARVDFEEGRVDTVNPVLVFMNAGVITGNSMSILDKGSRVRFTGGASMTINGDPGGSSEDGADGMAEGQ